MSKKKLNRKNLPDPKKSIVFFLQVFSLSIAVVFIGFAAASLGVENHLKGIVLGENVTVTGGVPWQVSFRVQPENRIKPTNRQVDAKVQIREVGTTKTILEKNLVSDADGKLTFGTILPGDLSPGYYDISIKGISHLNRVFKNVKFGPAAGVDSDLTYEVLFAGDSHPVSDNYVNSMDISYEVIKIYTADVRADLNRDSEVNSLEFPTLISHIYETGDE